MTPDFLSGPSGRIASVCFYPPTEVPLRCWILHVPAFGEEMNKSRAVVASGARALAAEGYAVMVYDPSGTGDSEGEILNWQLWREELLFLVSLLRERSGDNILLWGLRSGCLLLLDSLRAMPRPPKQLLLWQPVLDGALYIKQFLRLRVASAMMSGGSETVASLRAMATAGETLEVAGYSLPPEFIRQLEAVKAAELAPPPGTQVYWLDVVADAEKAQPLIAQKIVAAWSRENVAVSCDKAVAENFWTTQEIASAPQLLARSVALLSAIDRKVVPAPISGCFTTAGEHTAAEQLFCFPCEGDSLVGVLHRPQQTADKGLLLVVGGPQYRVGSHRQFVLLARALADAGVAVLRFDYRGMGDSEGEPRDFEQIQADIRCALDAFMQRQPQLATVSLWGLCDGASAACFYAGSDARVDSLLLLNPWVHSEAGAAKAYLKHYYWRRLSSSGFWRKLLRGGVSPGQSLQSLWHKFRLSRGSSGAGEASVSHEGSQHEENAATGVTDSASLAQRFQRGLAAFKGEVLVILSGRDLTAAEFSDTVAANPELQKQLSRPGVSWRRLEAADHTFSRGVWREQIVDWTREWMNKP